MTTQREMQEIIATCKDAMQAAVEWIDATNQRIAELEERARYFPSLSEMNALREGQNELDTRLTVVEEKTANVHLR